MNQQSSPSYHEDIKIVTVAYIFNVLLFGFPKMRQLNNGFGTWVCLTLEGLYVNNKGWHKHKHRPTFGCSLKLVGMLLVHTECTIH